ncbi:MAG: cytidine deaminase [Armatimonadetes bacterium]|nr:cytidine deaminase [Armatimonadota bacterium]
MISPDVWEEMGNAAVAVRDKAYAPYSGYLVGASVLGSNGRVYSGCNVENVSFGLTICAERSAVVQMVSDGCREIEAVVVATRDGGTPCGMCLQVLLEFAARPAHLQVRCTTPDGRAKEYTLAELIPHGFASEIKKK